MCYLSADHIRKCKIDDNICLVDLANEVVQTYSQGNVDIGLQSVDPLKIDKIDIVQEGNVQVDLKLRNIQFFGLSKAKFYKISGFKKNPENNVLVIMLDIPLGKHTASYELNGQLVLIPINGNGTLELKLRNLNLRMKFLTKKVVKNGKNYMKVEKAKLNYEYTR